MYFILVTVGQSMAHTRSFKDHGAGPAATRQEAIDGFELECEAAQHSANMLRQPIIVELLKSAGNDTLTISTRTLQPISLD